MEEAGDTRGVRRWHFGTYVAFAREEGGLSQERAAARAGLSRVQWSRIENGHDLPKEENISAIADAIDVDVGRLYARAGYPVPEGLGIYDLSRAQADLRRFLVESQSLAEFLVAMQVVWQEFQIQRLGSNPHIKIDVPYAKVLAHLYQHFSRQQRVTLAREILKHPSPEGRVRDGDVRHHLFDELDNRVRERHEEDE